MSFQTVSNFQLKRRKTREVLVGSVGIGKNHPIRIQSMTTSNTRDVQATVEQIMRLSDAGCEMARVTVQGMKEAESCGEIKNALLKAGYTIPLIADIHFFPPAAFRVADFVEKIRINPGNFVDKRASFKTIKYTDALYALEIEKIEEKFAPLIEKCKCLKRAMRIGTNHGSLSDRIMNRYGDTPHGMVESALEFAHLCRKYRYHQFVFSMKSSNPQVMILAYRLLAARMDELGWDYPLHLGVTEAGVGEDGRIKSAMGIGSLLLDGIGDTIRISLTEDAWNEIDPCQRLISFVNDYQEQKSFTKHLRQFTSFKRRSVILPENFTLHRDGSVILQVTEKDLQVPDLYSQLGCATQLGKPKRKISSSDCLVFRGEEINQEATRILQELRASGMTVLATPSSVEKSFPILPLKEATQAIDASLSLTVQVQDEPEQEWPLLITLQPALILLAPTVNRMSYARQFFEWIEQTNLKTPVLLAFSYHGSKEDLILQAAAECGALLCDGLGDGLFLQGSFDLEFLRNASFNILQAARMRTFKTNFISCPSCGRTLFDLQEVSQRIREKTAHLPGVKIAIMGCIVNGPGEMADADFGYVGSKPGMIDLYIGKQCVEKDIPSDDAVDRLMQLIKLHGRWIDPELF